MNLTLQSRKKLNNEIEIPILGFGTWQLNGKRAIKTVSWALEMGYRLIDTAEMYGNESEIGSVIKDSGIDREKLFITTKVWISNLGFDTTLEAFEKSLERLQISYVDLYLIHWPANERWTESWKALEKLYSEDQVRAIGVSNFNIELLKTLLEQFSVKPVVNQVEFSPFLFQKELLEFCQSNNISIMAYCPLTRGKKLEKPVLKSIAAKYNKSSAQILLRWGLQHRIIEIPKSGKKDHIKENSNVFDFKLDNQDMEKLDDLNEDFRVVDTSVWI
ncbi:MAG: aldo/keto reductase [Candidatus Lokiarchaeota archaeon]|nr:aldo/keto reductase [Candidatus Lokiarchaeota archaeon]